MQAPDEFLSIGEPGRAETRVQGSRFFGLAFHAGNQSDFDSMLASQRKEFYDATHWCWALRMGEPESLIEKSSDAGEPHGTAGLPILRQIQARSLFQCGVIVTRYFGGTKLGTGNLSRAYGQCAEETLSRVVLSTCRVYQLVDVTCAADDINVLYFIARKFEASVSASSVDDPNIYRVKCRKSQSTEMASQLVEKSGGRIIVSQTGTWISCS